MSNQEVVGLVFKLNTEVVGIQVSAISNHLLKNRKELGSVKFTDDGLKNGLIGIQIERWHAIIPAKFVNWTNLDGNLDFESVLKTRYKGLFEHQKYRFHKKFFSDPLQIF